MKFLTSRGSMGKFQPQAEQEQSLSNIFEISKCLTFSQRIWPTPNSLVSQQEMPVWYRFKLLFKLSWGKNFNERRCNSSVQKKNSSMHKLSKTWQPSEIHLVLTLCHPCPEMMFLLITYLLIYQHWLSNGNKNHCLIISGHQNIMVDGYIYRGWCGCL